MAPRAKRIERRFMGIPFNPSGAMPVGTLRRPWGSTETFRILRKSELLTHRKTRERLTRRDGRTSTDCSPRNNE